MSKSKEILLGVTGSIAAYKACDIVRRLQDAGYGVTVVMTKGAEEFITPLSLASLSGRKVYRELFEPCLPAGREDNNAWQMDHILLAERTDLLLIAPATANIIGKIANGIADDLLSCITLATKAKILIAPAMNTEMYKNKIVQDNIKKLKNFGIQFIDPPEGKLACGTAGEGHLADVGGIVKSVERAIKKRNMAA